MTRTLLVALDHQDADLWCSEHDVPASEAVVVVTSSPMPFEIHGLGTAYVAFAPGWDDGRHAVQVADVVTAHKARWGEPIETTATDYETEAVETR